MKNSYLFLLLLPFLFFIKPIDVDAFYVQSINDIGGVLAGQPYYSTADDLIKIDYIGTSVTSTYHYFTHANTGDIAEKTQDAPSGNYWEATGFTCIGTYDFTAKDSTGSVLLEMTIVIEEGDLNLPRCESLNELPSEQEKCGTMVCECIEALKSAMESGNVDIGVKLDNLAVIGNQIKDEIGSLHDEFQSDVDYSPKTVSNGGGGVSPMPNVTNMLNDNKPIQNTTPYKNDDIIFSDGGSAEIPGALPTPPDVKDWDGFMAEIALPPDAEQVKEGQLISDVFDSDVEMTKDDSVKDAEMTKDNSVQDAEMTKDNSVQDAEMTKDDSVKDAEMNKELFTVEPIMSIEQMQSTDSYGKTHVYEQTNLFP